jgi:DNA (cytosine-5)-methyltransferase 1
MFFEAIRIIKEMREATNGLYPTFAVAENVTGLLTADRGDAMARCLDTLAESGAVALEWCVLDAQWFGVPQKRRRVFLLACFDPATASRCPDPVFALAERGARHPAQSQTTEQTTARTTGDGTAQSFRQLGQGYCQQDEVSSTVCARDFKSATDLVVTGTPIYSFDTKFGSNATIFEDIAPTMKATQGAPPIVAFHPHYHDGARPQMDGLSPTVTRRWGTGGNNGVMVAQSDLTVRRLTPVEVERLMGWPDDHTLNRADGSTNSMSTRYQMCGNGVVAPVAKWVAEQIAVAAGWSQ